MRAFFLALTFAFVAVSTVQCSSASANEWVDLMLKNLRPLVIEKNGDPIAIPDMSLNFNFTFLFSDHEGQLNLSRGYAVGLSTLARHGDCTLNYELKILRLSLGFIVQDLLLDFEYCLEVLGMHPCGNLFAHITEQIINIDILIDTQEATTSMQHFEMPNEGKMKISIDGLGLLGDALSSVILAAVDNIFKDKVIAAIADIIRQIAVQILDSIHFLPPIPPSTESPIQIVFKQNV